MNVLDEMDVDSMAVSVTTWIQKVNGKYMNEFQRQDGRRIVW